MLFSELAKRVAEKYPEVKTAFPMDCELSNVELYDPSGAVPPVDTLGIYTARQISEDMTLPLCFVCAGAPDQVAHDKIAYSDSNYIIIPQVSAVDVVYYIMSLFGDSFKQQKLYSNLIYMLLNGADLTSVFCEFSKGTGSQLLAIDISGKVLAYSKPFMVNHPHWIHSIEVGYLDNYDAGKNTELYETLKIYTKTGFSKNRTAELMFMHRNTVNYRIQQIENLFSVDFSDPSLLFKLQYSFYIDAFLKNRYSDLAPLPEKPAGE